MHTPIDDTGDVYLPFITLDAVYGVNQIFLAESDDGTSDAIPLGANNAYPFGGSVQTQLYVRVIFSLNYTRSLITFLLYRLVQMDFYHLGVPTTLGLISHFLVILK